LDKGRWFGIRFFSKKTHIPLHTSLLKGDIDWYTIIFILT
jgi:hypothetical protein